MSAYQHVTPREHDARCRRGTRAVGRNGHALDLDNCARCRNLWQRLVNVGLRRRAVTP